MEKILIDPIMHKKTKHNPVPGPTDYAAVIVKGVSISIVKTHGNDVANANSFNIGDEASHDSYNLIYTGRITKITLNSVTIEDHGRARRLSLAEFARRNYNFNAERVRKENAETSMYL